MNNSTNNRFTTLLVGTIFIFTVSCSSKTEPKTPVPKEFQDLENLVVFSEEESATQKITITKDAVYGDTEDILIGRIRDVVVDSLYRVYIADQQAQAIYVFEPNAGFKTTLGRPGRGPSEFNGIKSLEVRNNKLHAFDFSLGQSRISIANLNSLEFENTFVLAQNRRDYKELSTSYTSVDEIYTRKDGSYLAKFKFDKNNKKVLWSNFDIVGSYYRLNSFGKITSEEVLNVAEATGTNFNVLPNSKAFLSYHLQDFFGNKHTLLSEQDLIFVAEPNHFLVKVYQIDGSYLSAFYRPIKKTPLSEESAFEANMSEAMVRTMQYLDLPENWPALVDMKMDNQNRLWIATTVENLENYEWWVLEDSGELISKFEWPRDKPIEYIHNNYIYTKETDEITSNEVVVRYEVEFEEILINQ